MPVNGAQFARMLDGTDIEVFSTWQSTQELLALAKQYKFYSVFTPRPLFPRVKESLKDSNVLFGCGCGLSGLPTEIKCNMAKDGMKFGCIEYDMVMNQSLFKSGMYDAVVKDIRALRDTIGPDKILKCIIETPVLSDDEIRLACELSVDGGADFVKTALGPHGVTTVHQIKVLSEAARGRVRIKASGHINSLEVVDQMIDLGVERFGLYYVGAMKLLHAADNR